MRCFFRRVGVQSAVLLALGALTCGQVGPCGGLPGGGGGGGGGGGNVVGVWQATYNDSFIGPAVVDLVLQADGTFSETYSSAVTGAVTSYITGPYTVGVGQADLLRLTVFDYFPKEFLGTPILPVAGESWLFSFPDANTMVLTNFYCTDTSVPGCVLTHRRVSP